MIGQNNVLNIRSTSSRWKGKIGSTRGFCDFDTVESCIRVGLYLFERTYKKRGLFTIAQMISSFAPSSDGNDTQSYIDYVSRCIFRPASKYYSRLDKFAKFRLFKAMCMMETNYELTYGLFIKTYCQFKNEK